MVLVAQLVEHSPVARRVAGSSPVEHPSKIHALICVFFVYPTMETELEIIKTAVRRFFYTENI